MLVASSRSDLDFRSGKWSDFISSKGKLVSSIVSPDGEHFFYITEGKEPRLFRIRLADRLVEEIVGLNEIRTGDDPYIPTTLNVTPDNSPLLTRDVGTQEVYSIALK